MKLRNFVFGCTAFLLLFLFFSSSALAQEIEPPYCDISDSTMAYAAGIDALLHPFGDDTITYPNEFDLPSTFPWFAQVFDLYVSDGVSDRWSESEWEDIIGAIMSNDTTNTDDDVFGKVWNYFVREGVDLDGDHAGVGFVIGDSTYTRIKLLLYDTADLPTPCSTGTYGVACNGYSAYVLDRLLINASPSQSESVVLGLGIAHELQHLCFKINGSFGYADVNETLSTLAEYLLDSWRSLDFDLPYDATFMRYEDCDANSKYQIEKIWITYLYEAFKGNEADPTDDLIYRWLRNDDVYYERLHLPALADVLWDADFDYLGGADASKRLNAMFGNFLVAKFCNAPAFATNGEFGMGPISTVLDFGLFIDNCTFYGGGATPVTPVDCPENPSPGGGHAGCWNVRIILPEYELTDDNENTMTSVSGIYEDGDAPLPADDGDGSLDYIDINVYGTDYVVFRPDSYFDDGEEHELQIRVGGNVKYPHPPYSESQRVQPIGWIMAYSSDSDTLQVHPEHLVFVEPVTFSPTTSAGDTVISRTIIVTDFGRSIKAVVLAMGAASVYPTTFLNNNFIYEYQYGVYTPGASTRTWSGDVYVMGDVTVPDGGTLQIGAGTQVKISNSDLAELGADDDRVEINVDGEVSVNGTLANPVTIGPWAQTTSEDWAGFYFSDDSEGGSFSHCTMGYAEFLIDSYAPIEIDDSTIRGASDALISMWGTTLDIDNSTIRLSNGDCIHLDDTDATIDSTLVEDYMDYGVYLSGNAALNITHSQFMGDAGGVYDGVGVYVENNTTNGTISETRFEDSTVGISYYNSTKPSIDECVITGNTTGIRLDHYSSASILHCIDSASYDGDITSNGVGIYCTDNADPNVGYCNISSNNTGVGIFDASEPDLDGYGANKFMSNSSKHVANLVVDTTVPATGNYWSTNSGSPNYYPNPSKISGSVDYTGALGSGPNPTSPRPPQPEPKPELVVTGLGQAHPNPFNPIVQIPFGVSSAMDVSIDIFDVNGRLVRSLLNGRKERGNHVVVWDGTTNNGSPTASAVYFVRMHAGTLTQTQKIVLLK
jgi:nitrous oxidase accessory protein NosD